MENLLMHIQSKGKIIETQDNIFFCWKCLRNGDEIIWGNGWAHNTIIKQTKLWCAKKQFSNKK